MGHDIYRWNRLDHPLTIRHEGQHLSATGRNLFIGVALLTLVAPAASGQTRRVEQVAQEQSEKAMRLTAEEPSAGERVAVRVLSSPLLSGTGGVYPWFGSVYPGTLFGTGVGYLSNQPRGGRFSAVAAVAVSGSSLLAVNWRLPALLPSGTLQPRVSARRVEAKDIGYYDVGSESSLEGRTGFDYQPTSVEAAMEAHVGRWVQLTGSYGYLGFSTELHGGGTPAVPMPGLGESIDYGVASLSAAFDWRTSPGYSTRGGLLRAAWSRYDANGGALFSFDKVEYEAVQLVPLLHEQYVLAFRGLLTETTPEPGHGVPFVFLPSVGGGDTVRGIVDRRRHDGSRAVFTAEYRWRPSRFLDMALFMDSGIVAPRLAEIDWDRRTTGWGIGARLHGPAFTALRTELAHSREGWVIVVGGSQPF